MSDPLTITFRQAKAKGACDGAYRKMIRHVGTISAYGRDTPMPLETVLDVCGLDDALWGLSAIGADRELRLWSCDCAEHVLPIFERTYPDDDRPRKAIEAGRAYAHGEIGYAAWAVARDAAWDAERAWQIARLREYLRGVMPDA